MNQILLIVTVLAVILAVIVTAYLCCFKKQIKDLNNQLNFIKNKDTNLRLTTQIPIKEMNHLVSEINFILNIHQETEVRIKRMDKNFRETITSVSHDIRTPLTSVAGYVQMLKKEDLPEEKRKEYVGIIQKRIGVVQMMLNQLFEYARIEAGELELLKEEVNINNLLRDMISMFYNDFCKKDENPYIVIPDEPYVIQGDKDALKRIMENLIHNSLIHGEGNYKIISEKGIGFYRMTFENETYSIEKEDIDQLFERFFTTDKSRTKKTTGLGLAIAKKLVEKMDGRIYARLVEKQFAIIVELPIIKSLPNGQNS